MPPEIVMTVNFTDLGCPDCGSILCNNGAYAWCSFIGGRRPGAQDQKACDFGIRERVKVDDPRIARPEARS